MPNIWDQDIKGMHTYGIPAERIVTAMETAREAFWASIAESFPEVTTGDMGPGDDTEMEWGTNSAVLTWLMYNHPGARDEGEEEPCSAS